MLDRKSCVNEQTKGATEGWQLVPNNCGTSPNSGTGFNTILRKGPHRKASPLGDVVVGKRF